MYQNASVKQIQTTSSMQQNRRMSDAVNEMQSASQKIVGLGAPANRRNNSIDEQRNYQSASIEPGKFVKRNASVSNANFASHVKANYNSNNKLPYLSQKELPRPRAGSPGLNTVTLSASRQRKQALNMKSL